MRARRVKFIWGGARVIKARWYLGVVGLYDRSQCARQEGIAVSVRGLLAWAAALGVVLYVAATTALFLVWQRDPYALQTYSDALLFPIRRQVIVEKTGRSFIARGLELYRAEKWHDAASFLRLGLERCPADARGRLTLAEYYVRANRRPDAMRVLRAGLTAQYPGRAYVTAVFRLAEETDDFDLIASTADRYVPQLQRDRRTVEYRWLQQQHFAAAMASNQPAAALAIATREDPGDMAAEHRVLALLALDRAADALVWLANWRSQPGADRKAIARLEARAHAHAKDFVAMDEALAEYRRLSPGEAAPLVYAVVQHALAGRESASTAALRDYVFRYGASEEGFVLVGAPLAEIGHTALLQQLAETAAEHGFLGRRLQILLVQAHIGRGEWSAAAREWAKVSPESAGRDRAAIQVWHEWTGKLLDATSRSATTAQTALVDFLRSRPWPAKIFRETIAALQRAGRSATARDALEVGMRVFPNSAWLRHETETMRVAHVTQAGQQRSRK